eukprot:329520-Chlamydomonas_euryale.AAC.8
MNAGTRRAAARAPLAAALAALALLACGSPQVAHAQGAECELGLPLHFVCGNSTYSQWAYCSRRQVLGIKASPRAEHQGIKAQVQGTHRKTHTGTHRDVKAQMHGKSQQPRLGNSWIAQ